MLGSRNRKIDCSYGFNLHPNQSEMSEADVLFAEEFPSAGESGELLAKFFAANVELLNIIKLAGTIGTESFGSRGRISRLELEGLRRDERALRKFFEF